MIAVRNAQRKVRVPLHELQAFAGRALQLCLQESSRRESALRRLDEITVVLVSDRRIAALHQQFMKISGPTDVITFEHGDIFISTETAQRQAHDFRTSVSDELKLYILHGLLHLDGFDDTSARAARQMEAVQTRLFALARQS